MRNDPRLLEILCCTACRGELRLESDGASALDGHVIAGRLTCTSCGSVYPIMEGVPRFVPAAVSAETRRTVEAFGYQWHRADSVIQNTHFTSAEVFLDFIRPVTADYFSGKVVLDAGCGSGRFAAWAGRYGAALVIGVDLSESVTLAFEHTRDMPNSLIIQADLFCLPLRPRFDYVFSVGVLHHTANPRKAFDALVAVLRPGGGLSAWVYGKEHNWWIIHFLNPFRTHITSRLPRKVLLVISHLFAVPVFVLSRLAGGLAKREGLKQFRRTLFYSEYLTFLSAFGFHEHALIVFDHLVPAIAEYIPFEEFERWFGENRLEHAVITSRAGNSWRGFGVRACA